jgi:hypothetical protein
METLFALALTLCAPGNCGTGTTDGLGVGVAVGTAPPRLYRFELERFERFELERFERFELERFERFELERFELERLDLDRFERLDLDLDLEPPLTLKPDPFNTREL